MGFHERLRSSWATTGSLLCVGLDPDLEQMPTPLAGRSEAIVAFCSAIVDATADVACAFKPQIAHFAAQRAEADLEAVCAHVRGAAPHAVLVLDAKRGDIGSTAAFYAREAFDRYGADCVTVNPYLGTDAATPFLERGGVLGLCRTSNPGSGELQDLDVDGRPLYQRVATMIAERWSQIGDAGLVVGATYPSQLAEVRAIVGDLPILLPGVGFQGGDVAASVEAGRTPDGTGLLASSSRAILHASTGEDFAEAARAEALRTRDALRAAVTAAA